ncbi:EsaB/YukD family protein [Lacrimispora sp. BS-2]|uniref:EsaB/YukD family protein n=1 Tax=Lacrimispora sp. BS-2 TaxID=3151850 RepID=A0AAU7PJS5_9FIRM
MILVDIYVPSVSQTYDFSLDEYSRIEIVMEEITAMICQKEQCELTGNPSELMLCAVDGKRVLSRSLTLHDEGMTTGNKLILV